MAILATGTALLIALVAAGASRNGRIDANPRNPNPGRAAPAAPVAATQATSPPATPALQPAVATQSDAAATPVPAVPPTRVPATATARPTLVPSPVASVASVDRAAPPAGAAPRTHEYVVQRGDTLFSISRRNGTTVAALVARNNLPSPDATIAVGQRLALP